jgi:hypothetical protein
MRCAGVSRYGARADAAAAFRPSEVWVAVVTRARRLPRLADMKKRALMCAVVLALLLLAGLGFVLRSGD